MKSLLSPMAALILINIVMSAAGVSLLMYTLTTYIQNTQIQQQSATKQGYAIIRELNNKLDILHNQSAQQIAAQGNLSNTQRQKIINEFENLPSSGLASHQDIENLIGNLSLKNGGENTTK